MKLFFIIYLLVIISSLVIYSIHINGKVRDTRVEVEKLKRDNMKDSTAVPRGSWDVISDEKLLFLGRGYLNDDHSAGVMYNVDENGNATGEIIIVGDTVEAVKLLLKRIKEANDRHSNLVGLVAREYGIQEN